MNDLRSMIEAEIPHLRRYAWALIGHSDEADDLVQSCLERALASADQWDPTRRLRPWLFRIQHNLYVSGIRRRYRERDFRRLHLVSQVSEANHDASLELSAVQRAMELLPVDQRTVILLVAVEGISYDEAAEILGVPIGTVRSRLSRARDSLRGALSSPPARLAEGGKE